MTERMEHLAVEEADADLASSVDEEEYSDDDEDDVDYVADPASAQLQGGVTGKIPYVAVYDDEDGVHKRGYFIPGFPVDVKVVGCERDTHNHHHMLNPHVYTLNLRHGPYDWSIRRRYNDFQHLHRRMLLHRTNERLKAPVRRIKEMRQAPKLENVLDETFGSEEEGEGKKEENKPGTEEGEDQAGIRLQEIKPKLPHVNGVEGDDSSPAPEGETRRSVRRQKLKRVPKFPLFPDAILQDSQIEDRKSRLERYLRQLLRIAGYRNHPETAEFLEVCRLSFVANLGVKTREGLVKKRPGGRKAYHGCTRCCVENCARWSKRWLVVKDSFIAYLHPRQEEVRAVLLYDKALWQKVGLEDFAVRVGASQTEGVKHGLLICNQQRDLLLKCETERRAEEWRDAILALTQADNGPARLWVREKRFNSYAPPRYNNFASWFADAKYYWELAANMIELAKEEIFIADWWLSPEIYMKRPMTEGNRWLLTELLKRKAEAGIHVFVLVYKEVEMALGINSWYSKRTLQSLHPNIRVLRHPDHVPGATTGTVMLWAHHEKLLIIDQMVAFIGGIDLCYGRWDDHRHKLTDLGSVQYHTQHSANQTSHSLMDGMRAMAGAFPSLSPQLSDEAEEPPSLGEVAAVAAAELHHVPPVPEEEERERESVVHSIKEQIVEEAREAAHAAKELVPAALRSISTDEAGQNGQGRAEASQSAEDGAARTKGRFKSLMARMKTERSHSVGEPAGGARANWGRLISAREGGKPVNFADLVDTYKTYVASGQAAADKLRGDTPPPERKKKTKIRSLLDHWKDERRRRTRSTADEEAGMEYEKVWNELTAEDLHDGKDEADRSLGGKLWIGKDYVNFIFKDFTDLDMPFMDFIDRGATCRMPWHDIHGVVYGAAARDVARHFIQRWNAVKVEKVKHEDEYPFLLPKSYINVHIPRFIRRMSTRCNVQILRSSCLWSAGINNVEDSIQQAYLSMIANAKHYIYIENQFFVSMIESTEVHNEIAKALLLRIVRAHNEGTKFRVYVNLPLMPAFEGQIGATGGSALQAVLYWTYQSISNGPHSLLNCLAREIQDPSRYIVFTGLRQHGELSGKLITELLYIHSKLIIVDDRCALIGSANINDRSQLGKRDSEMAMYVEDSEFTPSRMDGEEYQAGKFAGSLRRWLFREHLGLLQDGADPRKPEEEHLNEAGKRIDVSDPVVDSFYLHTFLRTASRNTDVFEKVFRCLPTDEVFNFEELSTYQQQLPLASFNPKAAREQLGKVQGTLVLFPTRFLGDSNLAPSITTKEGMAPSALFT